MSDTRAAHAEAEPSETERSEAAHTEAEATGTAPADPALLDRLRLIEDQPLSDRASALAAVHEELRRRLESGDTAGAS